MPEIHFLEILKQSFTLVILIGCSLLTLTFAVERWWFYRSASVDVESWMEKLRKLIDGGKYAEAAKLATDTPGPVASLASVALSNRGKGKSEVAALLAAQQIDERTRLEHYLPILGTMGNMTPFIGLFGTVLGIVRAFHDLAVAGSGGPAVVAAGISEALVATAAGLGVAIPSAALFNYFLKRVKDINSSMEANSIRLLVYLGMA
ncbi:MAG: MotA/TolQ/ExbB proton channel family protein [Elusimicrobiota bacterium]